MSLAWRKSLGGGLALTRSLFWAGAQTGLRMVSGFLSIKVTAIYLGPAGLALVGQLNNFISLVQGGVGNGLTTGVVTLTAKAEDTAQRHVLWGTALRLAIGLGAILTLGLWVGAEPIADRLLGDVAYWPVVVLMGASLPFVLACLVLSGALNGLKQVDALGLVAVVSAIVGAVIFIPASYAFGVRGALVGVVLSVLATGAVTLGMVWRTGHLRLRDVLPLWDTGVARSLVAFYPMLIVHSIAEPTSLLLVRDALIVGLGAKAAGIWQANWRLSDMYTQVFMTALSLYLMPHLSSIAEPRAFRRELFRTTALIAGLTALTGASIFLLRDVVIAVVLTREFRPVRELLMFQLIGDVLKMAGWPLRMGLVIKVRTRWYVFIEASLAVLQVGFTRFWIPSLGTQAATAGYAAAWGSVLVMLLFAYSQPAAVQS